MQAVLRGGTIVCTVGVIGAMGGYENGMYGLDGMLVRMLVFTVLTGVCVVADNLLAQRKRAKRMAVLKAHKSNKYEVIYSPEL